MPSAIANQIELAPGILISAWMLHFRYDRSGGPGGQNVNKLNTKATLTVALSDLATMLDAQALERLRRLSGRRIAGDVLMVSSEESRSQATNRRACIDKLQALVAQALVRPKTRKATRPSTGAKQRRLETKNRRAGVKRMRRNRISLDD